jgi:hypothetical protein
LLVQPLYNRRKIPLKNENAQKSLLSVCFYFLDLSYSRKLFHRATGVLCVFHF